MSPLRDENGSEFPPIGPQGAEPEGSEFSDPGSAQQNLETEDFLV